MVKNNYIPRTIVKQYGNIECTYILAKVEHSREIANQIESLMFEKIVEKYFDLDKDGFCSSAEIKNLLRKQSILDEDIQLAGFNFKKGIEYCNQYRAFLKYLLSIKGVKKDRGYINNEQFRGFRGISIRDTQED